MEKDRKRALRRHHNNRMRRRAFNKIAFEWWWIDNSTDKEIWDRVNKQYNHMCICSCSMCGNPRRGGGWVTGLERLTLQERKALDSYNDQIADIV